jgi:hypothetical protein
VCSRKGDPLQAEPSRRFARGPPGRPLSQTEAYRPCGPALRPFNRFLENCIAGTGWGARPGRGPVSRAARSPEHRTGPGPLAPPMGARVRSRLAEPMPLRSSRRSTDAFSWPAATPTSGPRDGLSAGLLRVWRGIPTRDRRWGTGPPLRQPAQLAIGSGVRKSAYRSIAASSQGVLPGRGDDSGRKVHGVYGCSNSEPRRAPGRAVEGRRKR